MSAANRASLLTKTHKVLKKHYKVPATTSDRTLLDNLIYACCLENAPTEKADEAFASLQESYFEFNEVRVTTITELSESMSALPDPKAAAQRVKKTLHSVFETYYEYDLEPMKKQNIGKAVAEIQKLAGVTPFVTAYVTQNSLGGHAIPLDKGALDILHAIGVAKESDVAKHHVPGVERAIPKTKGAEFAALLHEISADFFASPFSNRVRTILTEIAPDAKDRLPKRSSKKATPPPKKSARGASTKTASEKKTATKKKVATKKNAPKAKKATKKSAATKKKSAATKKKATSRVKKKSTTKRLSKKKPR